MNGKAARKNAIFIGVILVLAALLFLIRAVRTGQPAEGALRAELVYGDDNARRVFALDEEDTYEVDTGYLVVHIQVRDGGAAFVNSPCPDHICEGYGLLTLPDQQAVCLPARAVLTIVAEG